MASYELYNDKELVSLLQKDDEKAFAELYERYWKKLFFLAGKKLADPYEAEHIVQDVFLDLWRRRDSLDIQESVAGYLVVAVKYRVINAQARRYKQLLQKNEHSLLTTDLDNSTENWLILRDLQETLREQFSKLPEKCALAFSLREDGLSYKEIARTMGVSEKTVEMHISRAFKTLRAGLDGFIIIFLVFTGSL
jgi:RNA polymerase sigma-70 factor (family 1)